MLFNSISYAIFLPIVFILYWSIPHKYRWILLLFSSYYFYMSWDVKYVALILFTTIVSYVSAILMERTNSNGRKKILLVSTLIASLGVLFFFKYFNFFSTSLADLLNSFAIQVQPITLSLLLPVGISFYTFQTLSYVIDVYRGNLKAERHFGKYATFISFFPQLVAGPIERAENLLKQINDEHYFNYDKATYGLKLMTWGLFKKIIVADTLAVYVDMIYNNVTDYKGLSLIIATLFFAFQIYCDFSGYSDIAIGSSKLFGIDLMTNFKNPYFSASIQEFWSRWHISLSTWFKDYLYIPLGGNRVGRARHKINLLITFLVSGLWHGANWTYLTWGAIHGMAQVIEIALLGGKKNKTRIYSIKWIISTLTVFIICSFAWIFFRANSISEACYIITNMFVGINNPLAYIRTSYIDLGVNKLNIGILLFILGILLTHDLISIKHDVILAISKRPLVFRWLIYLLSLLFILLLMPNDSGKEFIYFQF